MTPSLRPSLCSLLVSAVLCGAVATTVHAADAGQRVQEEVQSALLRLVDNGDISAADLDTLSLAAPASSTPVFGAVIDARFRPESNLKGLPVAAVTPGGSAAALGLRAGDRLLGVNGGSLLGLGADAQGRAHAYQRLREALQTSADALVLRVQRGDEALELRGPVRVVSLPAYRLELGGALAGATYAAGTASGDPSSTCGRISVFDSAPRGRQIYKSVLIRVDGEMPGLTTSDSFRVKPGLRRLTVAEAIDPAQFNGVSQRQRDRQSRDRYKDLVVDVKPGVTYRLGARFIVDKRDSIRDNAYWEPVVWTEVAEACR